MGHFRDVFTCWTEIKTLLLIYESQQKINFLIIEVHPSLVHATFRTMHYTNFYKVIWLFFVTFRKYKNDVASRIMYKTSYKCFYILMKVVENIVSSVSPIGLRKSNCLKNIFSILSWTSIQVEYFPKLLRIDRDNSSLPKILW